MPEQRVCRDFQRPNEGEISPFRQIFLGNQILSFLLD
jgi:hypothetical protein